MIESGGSNRNSSRNLKLKPSSPKVSQFNKGPSKLLDIFTQEEMFWFKSPRVAASKLEKSLNKFDKDDEVDSDVFNETKEMMQKVQ